MRMVRYEMTIIKYSCDAPDHFINDIDRITEEEWTQIHDANGLNCDGGGNPGDWCSGCPWTGGRVMEEEDDDYDYSD